MMHPRPEFNRGVQEGADWVSLDGAWEFCFEATGQQGAPEAPRAEGYDRQIRVPFPWQSHLAWGTQRLAGNDTWYSTEALVEPGQAHNTPRRHGDQPQHEVGWYRRTFHVSDEWGDKRVILHIGAADWHVTVWCNGAFIGSSDSGYLPVEFDLTEALDGLRGELVIRVYDPMDHARQPVGKQWQWYTRTSGIWQPVWLEGRPRIHVTQLQVCPDADSGVCRVNALAEDCSSEAELRLAITAPTGEQINYTLNGRDGDFRGELQFDEAVLWTPETPELYGITATLVQDGQAVDEVYSYFGMRSVGVGPLHEGGPNWVCLNGRPTYLRGALDQSFNPWGVYSWENSEAARRDVELAKQAGFNFLRMHIKLEDPRFLYWCDKLGILLQCDMPCFGYDGWSDIARERHEALVHGAIQRDFNHPSIFSWCLFNETWGLGDGRDFGVYKQSPDRQQWVAGVYELAKRLDPTRLIEDNSPCHYDHVITDLNTWHFYMNDYEQAREHIDEVIRETYPGSGFNYVPSHAQTDAPLMNSEYGGIGAGSGDRDVSWCFRFLTNEMRKHEKICGYVYTELQDIEWECNGVYDYDRSPKQFGYDPALLQRETFVGFDCAPGLTLGVDEEFTLPMFLNVPAVPDGGQIKVQFTGHGLDSLGQPFGAIDADWIIGGLDKPGVIRRTIPGGANARQALPYTIGRPGLVRLDANLTIGGDAWNCVFLEIRDGRLPEIETLEDGRTVLRKLAGEFETSTAWHEAEVERGKVGEEQHLIAGVGSGHIDYRFEIPQGLSPERITILFEASSKRPGAPQTSADKWPSDLRIYLNDVLIDERTVGDQFADTRGALSHMHGFQGRYGKIFEMSVEGTKLKEALSASRTLLLRLEVPADACNRRGLTIYSSRAGSCPCDVTMILQ